MKLETKRAEVIVPSYSLTGDLLSYSRCNMQYRYYNRSELPPSRPVQFWYGEMVHGTLEMAYRYWQECRTSGMHLPSFPWPCTKQEWGQELPDWADHDIGKFAYTIEQALRHQGKIPRSAAARDSAYERVERAVNEVGRILFPLIKAAEHRVVATRAIPKKSEPKLLRASSYEVHGIIDVLGNVNLGEASRDNLLRNAILDACQNMSGDYEIIVEYKGFGRPLCDEPYWKEGEWQVQTYAWLRERQPDSPKVVVGIIIYINELLPGSSEMKKLRTGIREDTTDVVPEPGSLDEQLVRMWQEGSDTSQLSEAFRLRRAVRIVPITQESIQEGCRQFDEVVYEIESNVLEESGGKSIKSAWKPTCKDKDTCAACDLRWFCPKPAGRKPGVPTAP